MTLHFSHNLGEKEEKPLLYEVQLATYWTCVFQTRLWFHGKEICSQLRLCFPIRHVRSKTCFLNIRMLACKTAFGEESGLESGQLVCGTSESPAVLWDVGGREAGSCS